MALSQNVREANHRRTDIQGLRAVAIGGVVFYHGGVPGFSGGFVGVDVFFVVSGFLITGLLLRQLAATGNINLLAFWVGRAKRLIPNAALTLIAVLILGAILLPSYRYTKLAEDVTASTLFFANFHFAEEAVNYFNLDDPPSPAMHFWSLSVEEQYYWIWPLLLLATALIPAVRRHFWICALLFFILVGSFALSLVTIANDQMAAFFHTETRAWQLAAGGLLAATFNPQTSRIPSPALGTFAWLGAAAIIFAIFFYDDNLVYPGLWALMPVAGTVGVIVGAKTAFALPLHAALSPPAMQWIGRISYSWYLWHWPTIVFLQTVFPEGALVPAAGVLLSLLIAEAAYRFVEYPFHKGRFSHFGIMQSLSGATATVLALAFAGFLLHNLPIGRGTPERNAIVASSAKDLGPNYADKCHLEYTETRQQPCAYGNANAPRSVVLFGDSHAAQWLPPLAKAAEATGWSVKSWSKSSCPSIAVTIWYQPKKAIFSECEIWRNQIINTLTKENRPDLVILANSFGYYGWLADPETGKVLTSDETKNALSRGFSEVVETLVDAGLRVAVLRDTPRMYKSFRDCLVVNAGDCGRPRQEALGNSELEREAIESFGMKVEFLDLTDTICTLSSCPAEANGMIVYRDSHHLTATFATTLWPYFKKLLDRSSNARWNGVPATESIAGR